MEWADATLWSASLALPDLDMTGAIVRTFHHLHTVQRAYLDAIERQKMRLKPLEQFADPPSLRDWARSIHQELGATVSNYDPDRFEMPVELAWADRFASADGPPGVPTTRDALTQVAMHSAHHRGQICTMIREAGGVPPTIDLIVWIWSRMPAPSW